MKPSPHRHIQSAIIALAGMGVTASTTSAATFSLSDTAPAVNGFDIAQFNGIPGDYSNVGKWWLGTKQPGQTFTPSSNLLFRAITLRTGAGSVDPDFTFRIRVSTISNDYLTVLRSETATWTTSPSSAGSYLTFRLDTPVALSGGTVHAVDVEFTSSNKPYENNIPYLYHHSANPYAGGSSYTFEREATTATLNTARDYTFHLDLSHPQAPNPDNGDFVPSGTVNLEWTNPVPNIGTDVWVDVWFGTDPASLAKIIDAGLGTTSVNVSAGTAPAYYWRIDSYLDGSPTGTPVQGQVIYFVPDTDSDGLPDSYELAHTAPPSRMSLNAGDDSDADGLTNIQEYQNGTLPLNADTDGDTLPDGSELTGIGPRPATNPLLADTDSDGLNDGVESNSGIWLSISDKGTNPLLADTDKDELNDGVESNTGAWINTSDRGTNPLNPDTDGDGLKDNVETNTRSFVTTANTGTDPHSPDTDADGAGDWYEVTASFTEPSSNKSKPNIPYPLPDPDNSTGSSHQPVKIYILSGQSNMVGNGTVSGTALGTLDTITRRENKFPNLLDAGNNWTTRRDVLYRGVIADTWIGKLTVADSLIGPELGFGHVMGYRHEQPVLLIKASQGGRALGWDFRPPGSTRFDYSDGYTYAAYGEGPERWQTGSTGPAPIAWYSGKQYDDCFLDEPDMGAPAWALAANYPLNSQVSHNGVVYQSASAHTSASDTEPGVGGQWASCWRIYSISNVVDILDNFATEYPLWADQGFVIAGFVWWQGYRDIITRPPYPIHYEANMVQFIKQLRGYYAKRYPGKCSTTTPFVLATGCGATQTTGNGLVVANAQLATSDPQRHPEFSGNVQTVDIRNYWRSSSISPTDEGSHYNRNAETYMLTGDALGRAMIDVEASATHCYAAWQTANNAIGALDEDHDGDGVANGIEWFLKGAGASTGITELPGVAQNAGVFSITWTKNATNTGSYGTGYIVETSETLTGKWTAEALAPGGAVTVIGNDITFTFPSPIGTKKFVRLKVVGP